MRELIPESRFAEIRSTPLETAQKTTMAESGRTVPENSP